MSNNIEPVDKGGRLHGYCERYWNDGNLYSKGVFVHGYWYGYVEYYWSDGRSDKNRTKYYLDGVMMSRHNEDGCCYIWDRVVI